MTASHTRVKELREFMAQKKIEACIVPGADPHLSEYFSDYWKSMEWLSGFTGEAGTLVITAHEAFLWTDSRYFIQAEQELKDSPFKLMKMGLAETPDITTWLCKNVSLESDKFPKDNQTNEVVVHKAIGIDSRLFSADYVTSLNNRLPLHGLTLQRDFRPFDKIWNERPTMPSFPIRIYPENYAGEATSIRLNRINGELEKLGANAILLTSLDEIAWALNVRGTDVPCTPVVTAFAFLSTQKKALFIAPEKLTNEAALYLKELNFEIFSYDDASSFLSTLDNNYQVLADSHLINAELYEAIAHSGAKCVLASSPLPMMKALKNTTEINGERNTMLKDGIALTRFYRWLEACKLANKVVSELDCSAKLIEFRREQPLYQEESFPAIVAWKEHGALPHYFPNETSNIPIGNNGFLLIDTGGQYLDGTTDITRTIAIGNITEGMKRDYTNVLKGHIRLATAHFPVGTRGDQLDAFARRDMWLDHKTYRHGTSHGVGHYLNVHEGPESVRMEHNPVALQPGMVISNEPAIYLTGRYGIRTENCILVESAGKVQDCPLGSPCEDEYGEFLKFETLTLCYIDTRPIDIAMMNADERNWLNAYNLRVYNTLRPHLSEDEAAWLKEKTMAI